MTIEHQLIFRPQKQPSTGIPFGARSVGSYAVAANSGYRQQHRPRPMTQIFWFLEGGGSVIIGGDVYQVQSGQIAVYFPRSEHRLDAGARPWAWRYWTMDGPLAETICAGFGLAEGVYQAGPAPHDLFLALHEAIQDVSASGERRASALAYQLLTLASFPRQQLREPMVQAVLDQISAQWDDPDLSINQLAQRLDVHRSQLTRHFSAAIGVSPLAYITSKRIQAAQTLLKNTELPVAEIARRCGFSDPSYFTRVFGQRCGVTPQEFRHSAILGH